MTEYQCNKLKRRRYRQYLYNKIKEFFELKNLKIFLFGPVYPVYKGSVG